MSKPKFDPKKPFEVVDEVKSKQAKPKFDPSKPHEVVEEPSKLNDALAVASHGASFGLMDEAHGLAAKLRGEDYTTARDENRRSIEGSKERLGGIASPLVEAAGAMAPIMATPLRTVGALGELAMNSIQGAGEADEVEDIPKSMAVSSGIGLAAQGVGKVIGEAFDKPNKILARTSGARGIDFRHGREIGKDVADRSGRLDKMGFFRQGEVVLDPTLRKWVPNPNKPRLEQFLKPQSLDDLYDRAGHAITALRARNDAILANKKIPVHKIAQSLSDAARDFIPDGFDYVTRAAAAQDIANKIISDMAHKGQIRNGLVDALHVEGIKRDLQKEVAQTFNKTTDALSLTPESQRHFSTKLDDLVDSYAKGTGYKENNDLMHDLLKHQENMAWRIDRDAGTGVEAAHLTRGSVWDKAVDLINPAPAGVARARIGQTLDAHPEIGKFMRRVPVEAVNPKREPQSVPNIPEQFIRTPLPRTTDGLLKNKQFVLGKVAQMAPDMFETVQDVFDNNPEDLPELAATLAQKMPQFFVKDKYNRFDGRIMAEADKQKAIKDTLLNKNMSSIEQAKVITRLNKEGLYDH